MRKLIPVLILAVSGSWANAQEAADVTVTQVRGHVHMLQGNGGNIGLSAGEDVFLIDDQYAPMTPKIRTAIAGINRQPVRFIVNTHWHQDHTGGNENFGKTGAVIVAHDNVRRRMSSEQFIAAFDKTVPPSPPKALPVVTFSDDVTFHLNGDRIHAFHVPPAHTDGDTVIHFQKANVIHAGDVFFNGLYPFIDVSSGGSVNGVIDAAGKILELADEKTKIIPGHGPLADKAALATYRDMVRDIRDRVQNLIKQGKNLEQIQAAKPVAVYDGKWGKGFLKGEDFVAIVYNSLTGKTE